MLATFKSMGFVKNTEISLLAFAFFLKCATSNAFICFFYYYFRQYLL